MNKTASGVAWYAQGDGPPVLLIMGLAYPAAAWFRQIPTLSHHYRVLTLDNRGAGATGLLDGAPYTVELLTRDCLDVLDAANATRAHVVGISMGGLMAQELGLSHPERVQSLTLMSTHPGIDHAVLPADVQEFLATRATMPADQRADYSIPFNYHPSTPRGLIDEDSQAREAGTAGPDGYAAQGGTALWSGWDRLPAMTVPTQIVHGAQDRLVVPENGQLLADRIPDSKLTLVQHANHILTTDQTDEVNTLLLDWFAAHS